jgi:hypothetical protein
LRKLPLTMSKRVVIVGILACLSGPAGGETDQRTTLVANRDDVSFSVQAGGQRFDIGTVSPVGRQGSQLFEWQFDASHLSEALKTEFGLSSREIGFSELCARLSLGNNQEQRTCRKLGTFKTAETYQFFFYPTDKIETTTKDIYVIGSQCIIIGNDNLARC